MKLYVRLLWILLTALFRRRLGPSDPAITRFRVLPSDLDLFGHMTNARYPMIMDLGRIDLLSRLGLLGRMVREGWTAPIGCAHLEFRGSLRVFERYDLHTRVVHWDGHWFYLRQDFVRGGDEGHPVATGWVKTLFRARGRLVRPAELIASLVGERVTPPRASAEVIRAFGLEEQVDHKTVDQKTNDQKTNDHKTVDQKTVEREPIAIVGIGCRLPGGADDPERLWELLLAGADAVVDIPASRWDRKKFHDPRGLAPGRSYVDRAGMLARDPREFDPTFFGITPREAETLDPQQRLLLEASWDAFEDAGIPASALAGSDTAVFVGGFMNDNLLVHGSALNRHRLSTHAATASTLTMLSNRLSYVYDLRGPSVSVDTACSSSLVAFHLACRSLWSGESRLALTGGVNVILSPETHITMAKGRFLSPTGRCHAFDAAADGYVRAEGAALVVLKPLSRALADGDRIYALVRGTAVNQDGRTPGITVPSAEAQIDVMRRAYAEARVDPSEVSYVEAHGTGTAVGDPIEARALGAVIGAARSPATACLVGSIKTNLGHLEAGAGVVGLIRASLCLLHGRVPPHPHLTETNPAISLGELGLRVATEAVELPAGARFAGVNSFGYGGTNAHVVLQRAAPPEALLERALPEDRPLFLTVSARSPEALGALADGYAGALGSSAGRAAAICRAAGTRRSHHRHRLALWAPDARALAESLRAFSGGAAAGPGHLSGTAAGTPARPVFVYTGMGPQHFGMGRELAAREPVFAAAIRQCDEAFRAVAGWSIADELLAAEDRGRMARVEVAQPASAVLQIALTRLLASFGIEPAAIVGHSVGELAAAYAAGALTLEDTMTVAFHRSRLQQRLAGRGGMLAVALPPDEAQRFIASRAERVAIAAVNSQRSVTLAGQAAALAELAVELDRDRITHRALAVDVPYHSPVMDAIAGELRASLARLAPRPPTRGLYSTVTGEAAPSLLLDAAYWWRNVREPVRFADAAARLLATGQTLFLEVGPHPVLATSLHEGAQRHGVRVTVLASLHRSRPERESLAGVLAALYAAGADLDLARYLGRGGHVALPAYPFQRKLYWSEGEQSARDRLPRAGHPLLAMERSAPDRSFRVDATAAAHPYLADHVVGGRILFPAAGMLEAVAAAHAATTEASGCSLEDVDFELAVELDDASEHSLEVCLDLEASTFRLQHVKDGVQGVRCARGKLFSSGRRPAPLDPASLATGAGEALDAEAVYGALERRGLRYGEAFRVIRGLRRRVGQPAGGPAEVVARLELPAGVEADGYLVHPVLLDGAFHALIAGGAGTDAEDHDVVPVSIARYALFAPAERRAIAVGRVLARTEESLTAEVALIGEDGAVLARVEGLRCRLIAKDGAVLARSLAQKTYQRAWREVPAGTAEAPEVTLVLGPARLGIGVAVADDAALAAAVAERRKRGQGVHVLDTRWADPGDCEIVADPVQRGGDAAAALAETLRALVGPSQPARYFLLTTNAEAILPAEVPSLARAPLLGLARTAMSERPDLRLTVLDADPALAADADVLLRVLATAGPEQELACRAGTRYAVRLVRVAVPEPAAPPDRTVRVTPGASYALELGERGQLDSLAFVSCAREAPGPGELEIEVEVAALGFKDVLKVMGLISERIRANTQSGSGIGMEGTGRVSAVGPGVSGFQMGDRVYGVAGGFVRSHMRLPATHCIRLPDGLGLADGASLTVFLTVYHALVRVARLAAGETVLVHGATGGVGLAAIQVARLCGAEVIATAGNEDKRRYLRELGIERVTTSREVAFADDVRAWTGGRGVDVVLNFSPGEIMLKGISCLAPFGRFIELGKMSFDADAALPLRAFHENLVYASVDFDRLLRQRPLQVMALYREVLDHLARGSLRPLPATVFAARQVAEAFRLMARSKHIGKVLVACRDPELVLRRASERRPVADDATYLVTGGLGGFGLEIARHLAARGARHLVLVSRRGAASAEAVAAVAELRARGVQVRALSADVSRQDDVARVLAEIEGTMPPLRGVVHAAVVLDDRSLERIDRESLERVLQAKARGAWHLDRLTRGRALDFFLLCSSISSLIGNAGQANYVAANAFLDALAERRRREGLPATSVQWGALAETGLVARDKRLEEHLARAGLRGLSTREALAALERAIASDLATLGVFDVDWTVFSARLPPGAGGARLGLLGEERAPGEDGERARKMDRWAAIEAADLPALLASELDRIVTQAMRLPPGLDRALPLRELGMDSLLALEISVAVENDLALRLSAADFKGGAATIGDLAGVLAARLGRELERTDDGAAHADRAA